MVDSIPNPGLIYYDDSIFSWDSPYLYPKFSNEDITVHNYVNRTILHIIDYVEAQLRINKWHRWFFVKPPLHHSYTALYRWLYNFTCTDCDYLDMNQVSFTHEDLDEDTY